MINGLLVETGTFGPLTAIAFEDDTEDDPFGGPFGDPRFTTTLDPGIYTVLVASLNVDFASAFTITSNVGAAVPEPSSSVIFVALGFAALIRRRKIG